MRDKHETPLDAYVAAAAAPGTIDYFVLLFSDAAHRAALSAGLALGKVIMNIARQDTEADIRYLKLQWWREEAGRTRNRQARHPLTAALADQSARPDWVSALQRLIDGAHNDVGVASFDSLARLLPHCHYAAERQALLVSLFDDCDDTALASARAAGVGICLSEMLCNGDNRLPGDGFDDGTQDTTAQLTAIAEDHFAAMRPGTGPGQVTVGLQAGLYRQALHRVRDGSTMHPFGTLWRAWRQARKLRR